MQGKLFINGIQIENWNDISEFGGEENSLCLEIPDYILTDKKNSEKWIADIDETDAKAIEELTHLDGDKYIGKKIKIVINVLGPASRPQR